MKGVYSLPLLTASNLFMPFAWYGHLHLFKKMAWFTKLGLFGVIMVSWGLVLKSNRNSPTPTTRYSFLLLFTTIP